MTAAPFEVKDARILVAVGTTGCGKTTWLTREARELEHERLFLWDVKGELAGLFNVPLTSDWTVAARCLEAMKQGKNLRVAYRPPGAEEHKRRREQFARACVHIRDAGNMGFFLEEAHTVVEPGGGNEKIWTEIVSTWARDKKISLYIASTRPALLDKTSLSNYSRLRVFMQGTSDDQRACAGSVRAELEHVGALGKLEFIERDKLTARRLVGRLTFPTGEEVAPYGELAAARSAEKVDPPRQEIPASRKAAQGEKKPARARARAPRRRR